MKISLIFFLLLSFTCKAQDSLGIKFEKDLSWLQIKEKAKKENKYIFLDCYTTWCIPCKQMAQDIFPQKKVAAFFNQNFINVAVQIDKTLIDSENIKNWYKDAELVESTYKISSYPTYLFLNPDGILVHFIMGGSNADDFLLQAEKALTPENQYSNIKKEFANGRRDTSFLKLIISTAQAVRDAQNIPIYIKAYLSTQQDLLKPVNIKLIASSLSSSKDIGFNVFQNHENKVDSIIGKKERIRIMNTIAFDEDILPLIRINGRKEITPSGMITYKGEINKNVDWLTVKEIIDNKYHENSPKLIVDAKTIYYRWTSDWQNLNLVLLEYTANNTNIDAEFINNWVQYFISFCEEKQYFKDAKKWALVLKNDTTYHNNFSKLMDK